MVSASLAELAELVGGSLCGDGQTTITGGATIRDAQPGDITLADQAKLATQLAQCNATAAVVGPDFQPQKIPFITVDNVHSAFAKIVAHLRPPRERKSVGISLSAHISPTATIGHNVDIYQDVMIGDEVQIGDDSVIHPGARIMAGCKVGEGVTIFPNVVVYEDTVVGDRCILHAGAVIGAYGFGYDTISGRHQLSAQLGNVELGADVEIGACTTIDRGTYGPTVIGEGTKIDNQVQIAHNCRIGRHNLLCSHAGIAGSSTTGDYVVMAGQVGVGDHIEIGNQVTLGAKAGVMNNIADGESHVGIPATPVRDQMIKQAAFAKLPEMRKQFKALLNRIEELEQQLGGRTKQDAA